MMYSVDKKSHDVFFLYENASDFSDNPMDTHCYHINGSIVNSATFWSFLMLDNLAVCLVI